MEYKDNAKIVELESEVKQLKADMAHLQQENKEIWRILNTLINQNAVELSQIHTQKDKNNATNSHHGLSAGFTGQTSNRVSELAELRLNAFNSQQNSSSDRQDNGRHTPLRSLLASIDSTGQENGQSHSEVAARNFNEPRNAAMGAGTKEISRRGGAMGAGTKEISRQIRSVRKIYNYKAQLNQDELKECYQSLQEAKIQRQKEKYPNLESALNKELSELINKQSVYLSASLPTLSKEIAKKLLYIENLGYKVSNDNAKRSIEILKRYSQGLQR